MKSCSQPIWASKASTRKISTSNNTTLTLGGGDYFVCSLN